MRLTSYFQSKGYFDVKVEAHLDKAPKRDTVIYRITKEKKHKVQDVKLAGNSTLPSSQLTPRIAVEKEHFLSAGKFSDQLLRQSVKNLKAVYQSAGFSDVASFPRVVHNGGNVTVTFRVTEGPRDVVSSLKVDGANTLSPTQYAPNGLKLAVGQPYSQSHMENDRATIVANYLRAGLSQCQLSRDRQLGFKERSPPHQCRLPYLRRPTRDHRRHDYPGPRTHRPEADRSRRVRPQIRNNR